MESLSLGHISPDSMAHLPVRDFVSATYLTCERCAGRRRVGLHFGFASYLVFYLFCMEDGVKIDTVDINRVVVKCQICCSVRGELFFCL